VFLQVEQEHGQKYLQRTEACFASSVAACGNKVDPVYETLRFGTSLAQKTKKGSSGSGSDSPNRNSVSIPHLSSIFFVGEQQMFIHWSLFQSSQNLYFKLKKNPSLAASKKRPENMLFLQTWGLSIFYMTLEKKRKIQINLLLSDWKRKLCWVSISVYKWKRDIKLSCWSHPAWWWWAFIFHTSDSNGFESSGLKFRSKSSTVRA